MIVNDAERYHAHSRRQVGYTCAPMLTRPELSELDARYRVSLEQVPEGDVTGRFARRELGVRALAYLISGPEIHHERILRERYL